MQENKKVRVWALHIWQHYFKFHFAFYRNVGTLSLINWPQLPSCDGTFDRQRSEQKTQLSILYLGQPSKEEFHVKLRKTRTSGNIKMQDCRFVHLLGKLSLILVFLWVGMARQAPLRAPALQPPPFFQNKRGETPSGTCCGRGWRLGVYMANRMRNATIRQKRPIASDRAKPRMA